MMTSAPLPSRGRKLFVAVLYLCALGIGAAVAFCEIFGQFKAYDDEGYVMRSVQSYLDGHVLYEEVYTQYGPVFFLWKAGWHTLTGWPVSHDMVRLTTILTWLCTALLSSLASFRITRSLPIASAVYLLTFVMLSRIISESGHPQEFCALLLAALAYAATFATTVRHAWFVFACIGALMATLLLTKVNVGLYAGLAFCGALLSLAAPGKARLAASCALLGVAAIFPIGFMRAHVGDFWGLNYIAVATFSALAALSVVLFGGRNLRVTGKGFGSATLDPPLAPSLEERGMESAILLKHVAIAAAAFFAVSAGVIVVVLRSGISPAGFVHGVLGQHLGFADEFFHPPKFPLPAVFLAFGSFVAAIAYCVCQRNFHSFLQRNRTVLNAVGIAARLLLVMGVVPAASFASALSLLAFAVPWMWLVMVGASTSPLENIFFRRVGALLVVFEILQGYPIAGTQLTIATFLTVSVVSLCIWDLWRELQASKYALSTAFAWVGKGAVYASIAIAWAWMGLDQYIIYKNLTPLGLPGASWVRLKELQVAELRCVASNLRQQCDTFFSSPGLNSFYFWTELPPPTHLNATVWTGLLSDAQEMAIIAELERHPDALLVRQTRLDSIPRKHLDGQPLVEYLRARFKPVAQVGQYLLFADKARQMLPLVEAATLMPAFKSVALQAADESLTTSEQRGSMFQVRMSKGTHPRAEISRIVIVDSRNGRVLADSRRKTKQGLQILDANLLPVDMPLPAAWMDEDKVGTLYLAPDANWKPPAKFAFGLVRMLDKHDETIASIPLAQ